MLGLGLRVSVKGLGLRVRFRAGVSVKGLGLRVRG